MKKSLVIIGAFVLVFLLAAIALPILFKDRIQKAVDDLIAESVRAEITYHDFGLSLLKNFPNLNVSIEKLAVVGQETFEGDTLLFAKEISIRLNLFKVLFNDKLVINSIDLDRPRMLIQVLDDGSASYDIAVKTDADSSEGSTYDLGINSWAIHQGSIIYDDHQTGFYVELGAIDHEGGGDFSESLFDLSTSSSARLVSVRYQDMEYLSDKQIKADVTLEMDLAQSKYTFKENQVSINEFSFGFDGWLALSEDNDDMQMDLSFETHQNEFQYLLSLVPGMYRVGFENITSSGLVSMNGSVNGTYNQSRIPAFELHLTVADGMFQYPDLPTAVENINLELLVANEDGNPDHTLIDISKLHLDFGQSPLDGKFRIDGLSTPEIHAELSAGFDLAELNKMFPLEGTTLKGQYQLTLKAEGTYDSAAQIFPVIDASMELKDGFIKTDEFPESLEQFNLRSTVTNHSGLIPDTRIEVPDFSFLMDGEKFAGSLTLLNPSDYSWDVDIQGVIDLEKISKVFSLEDITLKGIIRGSLSSKGKMSSLEAEQYEEILTSGDFIINDFVYASEDLNHPFKISSGRASFTPQQITLTDIKALTGSTDLKINGAVSNYINYVFQENAPIIGTLNITSENVNLNEWMTASVETDDTEELSVLPIPTNIDFDIQSSAGTVYYDNMTLKEFRGQILVRDGVAQMRELSFNYLGGTIAASGTYDPRDMKHPKFDFEIDIQEVAFKDAFNTFNTVRILAPITQYIKGDFSSNFKLKGELQQNMMPALNTLTGNGLVNIITAALSGMDSKLVKGFTEITQFTSAPSEFNLNDVIMKVKIENGQLHVAPFTATFGDYKTIVSGSTGIDGSVDFLLNIEVPAGVLGTSVNQAIASLTGTNQPVSDKVNLNLNLSGKYTDPSFSLGGVQGGNTTAGLAQTAIKQKSEEAKDSAVVLVKEQSQKLTESAMSTLDSLITGNVEDSASSESLKSAAKELLNKEKVGEVLNLFKRKKSRDEGTKDEGTK